MKSKKIQNIVTIIICILLIITVFIAKHFSINESNQEAIFENLTWEEDK